MKKQKKYKIDEAMNNLNLPRYKAAIRIIPQMLGIAFNTFHNYRKMTIDNKADIPYEMVRKMEMIFKLKEGELPNYKIDCRDLDTLMNEEDPDKTA